MTERRLEREKRKAKVARMRRRQRLQRQGRAPKRIRTGRGSFTVRLRPVVQQ